MRRTWNNCKVMGGDSSPLNCTLRPKPGQRERGMKKGDIVMVYEDPISEQIEEGQAKILHIYSIDKMYNIATCDVRFLKSRDEQPEFRRIKIK